MTETEQVELVTRLDRMAGRLNMMARLYEEASATVAGFRCEADYQREAADAFAAAQESIDAGLYADCDTRGAA